MSFDLDNYNTVPERIEAFFKKYPEGVLQQVKYELLGVGNSMFLVYTAAARRHKDDPEPGHGTAWEPVPGKTPYTRDSEMQNAETSAWGRAIVAVGAADTRKGIASREDVQSRRADQEAPRTELDDALDELDDAVVALQLETGKVAAQFYSKHKKPPRQASAKAVRDFIKALHDEADKAQRTLGDAEAAQ